MAQSAIDKIPPGPKLDALTAEEVFGWKNVHKHEGTLVGKKQDKAGRWRLAKVPYYSTNPVHAYPIEDRMKQLGRLDRIPEGTCQDYSLQKYPLRLGYSGSTLPGGNQSFGTVWQSHPFAQIGRRINEYRDSTPCTSVVHNNQLWNLVGLVSPLYAGTQLDVSVPRQMVSTFSGAV
jgi:hypothetical protein